MGHPSDTGAPFERGSQGKLNQRVNVGDIGPITQSRNRKRLTLSETYAELTNTVKWAESDNIREVSCMVIATATTIDAMLNQSYNRIVVNSANEVIAAAMLVEVDSEDTDDQAEEFGFGYAGRIIIRATQPIVRLDVLPVDVGATLSAIKLFVGAH